MGGGQGQCLGPLWAVGLRLKEQTGPRHAPDPCSQRAADLTWEPSSLPGLEWARQTPSSPLLLLWSGVWEGPSCLTLLIFLASLLWPQDQCGQEGKGVPWRAGDQPGSTTGSPARVGQAITLRSSRRVPPTCLS